MNAIKNLTVTILIFGMFFCLPQGEAEASGTVDDVIAAAMNLDNPLTAAHQPECNGFYTMFSPCYKAKMNIMVSNGDDTHNINDTFSNVQSLISDEEQRPVWHSEYNKSEPPSVGAMISVLHF